MPLMNKRIPTPTRKERKKKNDGSEKREKIGSGVFQLLLRCGSGVMMWNPNLAPTRRVGGLINPECVFIAGSGRSTQSPEARSELLKKMSDRKVAALCATWPRIA